MNQQEKLEKLPETRAFQDKFTREFMSSKMEVKEGYYLFESKTKGYTMLYPRNAKMSKMFYERQDDYYEAIHFGEGKGKGKDSISYDLRIIYEDKPATQDIELNLELLSDYKGEYEVWEEKDVTIYYAKDEFREAGYKNPLFYGFFGYIKSKNSDQAIRFSLDVACRLENNTPCTVDVAKEEQRAKLLIKSIKFF